MADRKKQTRTKDKNGPTRKTDKNDRQEWQTGKKRQERKNRMADRKNR